MMEGRNAEGQDVRTLAVSAKNRPSFPFTMKVFWKRLPLCFPDAIVYTAAVFDRKTRLRGISFLHQLLVQVVCPIFDNYFVDKRKLIKGNSECV